MIQVKETKDHELLAALNEEVQDLHHRMHPEIFKPFNRGAVAGALRLFVAKEDCRAYVAWKGEEAVGYVILCVKETGDNAFHYSARTMYVDQVGVPVRYRKQGVGAALLHKAEELAKELVINCIELEHWTANATAAAYFRKQGYKLCREKLRKGL